MSKSILEKSKSPDQNWIKLVKNIAKTTLLWLTSMTFLYWILILSIKAVVKAKYYTEQTGMEILLPLEHLYKTVDYIVLASLLVVSCFFVLALTSSSA